MLLEKKSRNSAATAENSGPFDETGTAHWNLRVGTNTNMYVYVLGYAKVEDSSSGNSYTLYTGVQAVKYSDLPVTAE
jgi:hypothetical protein